MTVYVDDAFIPATVGRFTSRWCHLFSDTSDEELHEFAAKIGLRRAWFQHPDDPKQSHRHYDVTEGVRKKAVKAGAVEITWRDAAKLSLAEARRVRAERDAAEPT